MTKSTTKGVQRWLAKYHYYGGAIDGVYGPRTTKAVRAFQTDARITVDGICGPQTRAAMRKWATNRVIRKIFVRDAPVKNLLSTAVAELGYHERPAGSNRTKYGKWYGMDGQPWCDMFVSWVAFQAGCGKAVGKFASTKIHAGWFKKQGRWGQAPKIGAIVFFHFGDDHIHHVGIVEKINDDGSIQTIEGNTSITSDDNGGEVMRRTRKSGIAGYGYPRYR